MQTDLLIVGSGIAGLSAALMASSSMRVVVATKRRADDGSTRWAQGGIAAAVHPNDDTESHILDTLAAGGGLCRKNRVRILVQEGPRAIQKLLDWGTRFTPSKTEEYPLDLALEGGHSHHRILHSADRTGFEIERALLARIKRNPFITLIEDCEAIELILKKGECLGVNFWQSEAQKSLSIFAQATLLATGGFGQLFEHTTNPSVATGDGISIAYRAGASVEDMEFVQFHPTGLAHPQANGFLISEAVRGLGAHLLNHKGERFMLAKDPRAELAPRDVVARALFEQMQIEDKDCVFLSLSHLSSKLVHEKFPAISEKCAQLGLDLAHDLIPVAPSAHYVCGGIKTTRDGKSTLPRLYAVGEVACTGVHGANRLASNSLLEGIVFARRAVKHLIKHASPLPYHLPLQPVYKALELKPESEILKKIHQIETQLRHLMSLHCGIVREQDSLQKTLSQVLFWKHNFAPAQGVYSKEWLRLKHLLTCGELVLRGAIYRKESRGLHYRSDYKISLKSNARYTLKRKK